MASAGASNTPTSDKKENMPYNHPKSTRELGRQRVKSIMAVTALGSLGATMALTAFVSQQYPGKTSSSAAVTNTTATPSPIVSNDEGDGQSSVQPSAPVPTPVTTPAISQPRVVTGGS